MRQNKFHRPVLAEQAVDLLITDPRGIYVDTTTGGGGHSKLIMQRLSSHGRLLCIDADPDAIHYAREQLKGFENRIFRLMYFDQADIALLEENMLPATGFLFDLGISSFQIDRKEKGFAFQGSGPLDMRFDPTNPLSAETVVNEYPKEKLETIFREYGEERQWRRIADKIAQVRGKNRIKNTAELAEIIRSAIPSVQLNKTLARIFQAIRIEVNDELHRLERALNKAFCCLDRAGRIVVISYHSLEDRIVKEFFREKERDCICPPDFPQCVCDKRQEMHILTRRPVTSSENEIRENPRSRSARMRAAEKTVNYSGIL